MYNKNFYVVCYKRRVYKFKKHPEIFNIFLMNHQWMTQITLIPSTRGPVFMFAIYAQSQEGPLGVYKIRAIKNKYSTISFSV